MFAIFLDGSFYSFWSNKKNDIWYKATIPKIKPHEQIECFWYEINSIPADFEFDESRNLKIYKMCLVGDNENGYYERQLDKTINKEDGSWL